MNQWMKTRKRLTKKTEWELRKLREYDELDRKYKIKEKGIVKVLQELKQRLHVKASKLKRYD